MKKVIALLLGLTLVASMFTGCGKKATEETTTTTAAATTAAATEATTAAATTTEPAAAKTGLAIVTSIDKSTPAGEKDGLAQANSAVYAVLVGADGKILDCKIDGIETMVNFTKEGKITTDLATVFKTKQELGAEYGMKAQSKIGKEWNEQADAFAAYVVGKTIDEVKGIAVTADGKAGDADLVSSVTIHIGGFINGVATAVSYAQDLGAKEGDKLGLGVTSSIARSKDASAKEAGLAQAYNYYNVVTTGADGKVTSSFLDASIAEVNFDTKGAISTDLKAAIQSKQELKDAYGMKKASKIAKEWYEQANAFSAYITGKTADEVNGIAVTADGLAGDADLVSSVTVHVGPFIAVANKAIANAK